MTSDNGGGAVALRKILVQGFSAATAAEAATLVEEWCDTQGERVLIDWSLAATSSTIHVLIFYTEG